MEISRDTKGVWRVYTENSSYILDLDNKKALRLDEDGKSYGNTSKDIDKLMKLKGWFEFKIARAVIGNSMFMWVASQEDPKSTVERQSTTVRQIVKIS